jgi:UDP-N-acetyl-D-glucosamine dehydrogenase
MLQDINQLKAAFKNKTAKIGIIGLGYVGLPLVMAFIEKGFHVYGFDIDQTKITALNHGQSYINHISNEKIANCTASKQFRPTSDFTQISLVDAILICVPTPLTQNQEPDLSYIISTGELIAPHLKISQLIVLESTTYPGTSAEVLKPILEKGGLKSKQELFLAYSPEREDPGNQDFRTASIPKIVGGDGDDARELACTMYNQIVINTVPVSSLEVAEAVKLTENIFRAVNIAMVNELKVIYGKMGIDIWEVIEAAKSKPFGYMPFYPGPGLGGHCIPIDPFYLTYRAKQFGQETKFIELAGNVNTQMPNYVIGALEDALRTKFNKKIKNSKILILGLAYKKNIDDTRESPAFALMELLKAQGASVAYYDPLVNVVPATRDHSALAGLKSIDWSAKQISEYDAALICTDHDNVDYEELVAQSKLIIDTRNATALFDNKLGKIIKA